MKPHMDQTTTILALMGMGPGFLWWFLLNQHGKQLLLPQSVTIAGWKHSLFIGLAPGLTLFGWALWNAQRVH